MIGLLPEVVRIRETKADFTVTYLQHLAELRRLLMENRNFDVTSWVDEEVLPELFREDHKRPEHAALAARLIWSLFACATVQNSGTDLRSANNSGSVANMSD